MNFALRIYRWLAHSFPHEFQLLYGTDVIQLGEHVVKEISKQHGVAGLLRLIADIAIRLPIEYLSEMRRDLRYTLRALRKSPGFAAVSIISLGLALSVTAIAVSEIVTLILRDAPGAREPDHLVMVPAVSYPYFEHYRDQHDLFAGAAVFQSGVPYNVAFGNSGTAKAERVFGHLVSPDYFSVIGLTPARGRVFSPDVDKPGSMPPVFISDRFWRERMNADPDAVGRAIHVNGQLATIVGIGPKDFLGMMPIIPADIFVPTTVPASMAPELAGDVLHKRDAKAFIALLRTAPGVTVQSAEAGVDTITRHLDDEFLDPARRAKGQRVILLPGGKTAPVPRSMMPLVFGFLIVLNTLIIAIACMNLANMQLARATARQKEVAIRLSVGASRFRLIRQLLTESALLSLAGGGLGILSAFWAASAVRGVKLPGTGPVHIDITPNWTVMLVVFAISLIAGIGSGLVPALAATKTDLASTLKEGITSGMRGYRRFGLRNLLMVGQVAGSLMLLLIAGFVVIGFSKTNKIEIAFDASTMYLMSLDPVRDGYSAEKTASLFERLPDRLKQVPSVREVALSEAPPFAAQAAAFSLTAPGQSGTPDQIVSGVAKNTVGARYFASLDVPIIEGREFAEQEQRIEESPGKVLPVVINSTAAHEFFGGRESIGRRILDGTKSYEVIGVVKDLSAPMSQTAAGTATSLVPVVYLPLTRGEFAHPPGNGMLLMVRSDRGVDTMAGVRRELAAIDPNLAIFNLQTLAEQVNNTITYLRFSTFVYGGIGVFGLILAAVGLAGVTAYSVARRRKEIGIRMALGAKKAQVLGLVMKEGGSLVAAGSALGFLGALAISRLLSALSSIFGPAFAAGIHDPRLIFGAPLLLATLAMLACYLPARRSTKIDPLVALRDE